LGLDIFFIVAKAKKEDKISTALYTALSFIGLCFSIYFLDQFFKYGKDLRLAHRTDSKIIKATSTLRMASKFNDLALTCGSCTAAVAQQTGNIKLMKDVFKVTIPYGEAAVALAVLARIVTLFVDRQTLKKLRKRDFSNDELLNIFNILSNGKIEGVIKPPTEKQLKELEKLAARIQSGMDKDTRRKLKALIEDEDPIDPASLQLLKEAIEKNVAIQVKVTQGGGLVVMAGNYLLLAVSDAFPNSIVGASCEVTGYFLNLGYWMLDKILEARSRKRMDHSKKALYCEKLEETTIFNV